MTVAAQRRHIQPFVCCEHVSHHFAIGNRYIKDAVTIASCIKVYIFRNATYKSPSCAFATGSSSSGVLVFLVSKLLPPSGRHTLLRHNLREVKMTCVVFQ